MKRIPLLLTAFAAFHLFNYATTHYALTDLLGDLAFFGVRWAVILAIAFCAIDLVGVARLFAPEYDDDYSKAWYLFGPWALAAALNTTLTWWGFSLALNAYQVGNTVPALIAVFVWSVRVLIVLDALNFAHVSRRSFG